MRESKGVYHVGLDGDVFNFNKDSALCGEIRPIDRWITVTNLRRDPEYWLSEERGMPVCPDCVSDEEKGMYLLGAAHK